MNFTISPDYIGRKAAREANAIKPRSIMPRILKLAWLSAGLGFLAASVWGFM